MDVVRFAVLCSIVSLLSNVALNIVIRYSVCVPDVIGRRQRYGGYREKCWCLYVCHGAFGRAA